MTKEQKETDRIARLLAKVASGSRQSPGGYRVISDEGGNALAALLTEIDETVLARRLEFRLDGDTSFACVARGGRLIKLESPEPRRELGAAADLFGDPLDTGSPATAVKLHSLLSALLGATDRLSVRAVPLTDNADIAQIGFAAEALAKAWSIELDGEPVAPPPLDAFLASSSELAEAWLHVVGGVVISSGGSAEGQARMTALAENAQAEPPVGAAGGSRCTIVGRQDQTGAVVRAEHADEALLLLVKSTDMNAIAKSWHKAFG